MQILVEGRTAPVRVEPGDTILKSLLRGGVPFAYSCEAGTCGRCKCVLLSGDVFELEHSEGALGPAERARGIVLACRAQARADLAIRLLPAA